VGFFIAESSLQQKGLASQGDQMFRQIPTTPIKKRNGRKFQQKCRYLALLGVLAILKVVPFE